MKKNLNNKITNVIYVVIVTLLYMIGLFLIFSSKETVVQESSDREGVYFSYKGREYKVFMIPPLEEIENSSELAIWVPDDTKYHIVKDRNFCEKYDLWNGHCSCYKKMKKLDGKVTVTMNWTGEPKKYTFYLLKYEDRKVAEVVHISDGKGACGYGYSTDKLKM